MKSFGGRVCKQRTSSGGAAHIFYALFAPNSPPPRYTSTTVVVNTKEQRRATPPCLSSLRRVKNKINSRGTCRRRGGERAPQTEKQTPQFPHRKMEKQHAWRNNKSSTRFKFNLDSYQRPWSCEKNRHRFTIQTSSIPVALLKQ